MDLNRLRDEYTQVHRESHGSFRALVNLGKLPTVADLLKRGLWGSLNWFERVRLGWQLCCLRDDDLVHPKDRFDLSRLLNFLDGPIGYVVNWRLRRYVGLESPDEAPPAPTPPAPAPLPPLILPIPKPAAPTPVPIRVRTAPSPSSKLLRSVEVPDRFRRMNDVKERTAYDRLKEVKIGEIGHSLSELFRYAWKLNRFAHYFLKYGHKRKAGVMFRRKDRVLLYIVEHHAERITIYRDPKPTGDCIVIAPADAFHRGLHVPCRNLTPGFQRKYLGAPQPTLAARQTTQ